MFSGLCNQVNRAFISPPSRRGLEFGHFVDVCPHKSDFTSRISRFARDMDTLAKRTYMLDRRSPLLVRRGACASNKKPRSLRSGAGGVVAHEACFCERPPRPLRLRRLRGIFIDVASTPPHEEGTTLLHQNVQTPVPSFLRRVSAPVKKCREASLAAQTGWSLASHAYVASDHPVRSA
jgi:hypothetical protein